MCIDVEHHNKIYQNNDIQYNKNSTQVKTKDTFQIRFVFVSFYVCNAP